MRLIPRRAWVEFIGGPADGQRKVLPLNSDGEPPPTQIWSHAVPGVAQAEYRYHLYPAPEGARAWWHYRLDEPPG